MEIPIQGLTLTFGLNEKTNPNIMNVSKKKKHKSHQDFLKPPLLDMTVNIRNASYFSVQL